MSGTLFADVFQPPYSLPFKGKEPLTLALSKFTGAKAKHHYPQHPHEIKCFSLVSHGALSTMR